jgi:D-lactate dehydrogenase
MQNTAIVCVFVNDVVDAEVTGKTGRKWSGKLLCCAGFFNNVDPAAEAVCRVPSYSEVVAEHW